MLGSSARCLSPARLGSSGVYFGPMTQRADVPHEPGRVRKPGRCAALLGLDLGSSSLKALLLSLDGRVLGERSVGYPTLAPAPGWAEQDPEQWWAAAGQASRLVLDDAGDGVEVVGIGLSGQMHTFVLLGADGRPVRNAITWMDTRAVDLLPEVSATIDAAGLRHELANPVVLGLSLPPLLWLQTNEPASLAGARTLLLAKDTLRERLTGCVGSEVTDASATLLFDVAGRRWSTGTAEAFGLPIDLLPPLGEPGGVAGCLTKAAAGHLGLVAGIPVAFGAGDQQAAAVGTGTVRPGQVQLMVGTGAQALLVSGEAPSGADAERLHAFCHARGWLLQASVNNAGVALDWVRSLLGLSWPDVYGSLGDGPDRAPVFLPYLTGERAPLMKGHARGGWLGLEPAHDRYALARAAVSGVVTAIADGLRSLPMVGDEPVRAAGGGMRDPTFAQAVADASGRTLDLLDAAAASAVGAALLGGVAAGVYEELDDAVAAAPALVAARYTPRPERFAAWTVLCDRFHCLDAAGLHEIVARA